MHSGCRSGCVFILDPGLRRGNENYYCLCAGSIDPSGGNVWDDEKHREAMLLFKPLAPVGIVDPKVARMADRPDFQP